jgi:glycosyltransferase involved in cell wall biosynthesis
MTKVLFIAYFFPPAGGAGVQRTQKFVQYLPDEGFLPVVITGPTSPDHRWTPHDRTLMSSIPDGVPVHRVDGKLPATGGRLRGRLNRWLRLPTVFSNWWIQSATELGLRVADDEELIFATMSPFESGEVARRLSRRLGIPWVADLRDPWALDEMQVYPSLLHRRLEMRHMERVLATSSLIIMNTPEATKALRSAFPRLRHHRVITVTNGFDNTDFARPLEARADGKFRIVHTGYLHTDNGLELRKRGVFRLLGGAESGVDILTRSHTVLLEAIERWHGQRGEVRNNVEIVFAGKISEEDRAVINNSPVAASVRLPGYLSHLDSVELVRTADVLFLPMHNLPRPKRSRIVPGKTYEYMAAARPILAAVPEGDARDFLTRCGTALICQPDDAVGMAKLLDQLYTGWKNKQATGNSNKDFVNQFDRHNLTRTLASSFNSLLATRSRIGNHHLVHVRAG